LTNKCISIDSLKEIDNSVLVYGHFSFIHHGHFRYLKNASKKASKLIVALIGDANDKYKFSQAERAEGLSSIELIDTIVLLHKNELAEAVFKIKPKEVVLGKEYEYSNNNFIDEVKKSIKSINSKITFHAGNVNYATSDFLTNSTNQLRRNKYNQFKLACQKQNISEEDLYNTIDKFKYSSLIIIGDTILDQYSACEPLGMSAEAPLIVVKEIEYKNFIGGAAVVAANVKSLGGECNFISVIGGDQNSRIMRNEMDKIQINHHFVEDQSRPTTFKKRYMVENQKIFRVSKLSDESLSYEIENRIISKLEELAPKADGIIISDFVYGVITKRIIDKIRELSKKFSLKLFGDLQCSSQVGNITKFENFELLCPNEKEARLAFQDQRSGLEVLSKKLFSKTKCNRLIIKLGGNGFIAFDRDINGQIESQSFPALSTNPLDVAGAGDCLLSIMAAGLSSGGEMMHAAAISACGAALSVENIGNIPLSKTLLKNKVKEIFQE
tara:strand:- start:28 stop:1518 length:1491 start_codon:yes stop_codon:yes gene_type:complete